MKNQKSFLKMFGFIKFKKNNLKKQLNFGKLMRGKKENNSSAILPNENNVSSRKKSTLQYFCSNICRYIWLSKISGAQKKPDGNECVLVSHISKIYFVNMGPISATPRSLLIGILTAEMSALSFSQIILSR